MFYKTIMGQRLIEGVVPSIAKALEGIYTELKRANDIAEKGLEAQPTEDEPLCWVEALMANKTVTGELLRALTPEVQEVIAEAGLKAGIRTPFNAKPVVEELQVKIEDLSGLPAKPDWSAAQGEDTTGYCHDEEDCNE